MLVLKRKPGEKIVVGEIAFEIVEVRGNKVRVGITAPRDQQILRGELVTGPPAENATSVENTGSRC